MSHVVQDKRYESMCHIFCLRAYNQRNTSETLFNKFRQQGQAYNLGTLDYNRKIIIVLETYSRKYIKTD